MTWGGAAQADEKWAETATKNRRPVNRVADLRERDTVAGSRTIIHLARCSSTAATARGVSTDEVAWRKQPVGARAPPQYEANASGGVGMARRNIEPSFMDDGRTRVGSVYWVWRHTGSEIGTVRGCLW